MKSFATSSFGVLTSLFFVFANLSSYTGSVQAAVLPRAGIPSLNVPIGDLIPQYFNLMKKCNADDAAVRILDFYCDLFSYGNRLGHLGPLRRRQGGHLRGRQVYPKKVGQRASRSAASGVDCTGGAVLPVPLIFASGLTLINPFDVTQLVGGSVLCEKF